MTYLSTKLAALEPEKALAPPAGVVTPAAVAVAVDMAAAGAEAAVERGKKPKSRKRGYSSLPLEDEYRVHTKAAEAAKTLCEQIAAEIGKALKGISALRAENPGPFLKVAVAFQPLPHFLARSPHASSTPPDPLRRSPSTR